MKSSEKSKIELAREQLKWSIETLPKGVHFNVIFYATDVQVWKEPPEMVPATKENKQAAIDWFMEIDANGYTRTFDALGKALDYASGKGGADTVFLLSDGSPTAVDAGEPLTGETRWRRSTPPSSRRTGSTSASSTRSAWGARRTDP